MMRILLLLLKIVLFVLLLGFAFKNTDSVVVHYFADAQWQAPLVLVLLVFFGIGIAAEHIQEIYRPFFSTKPGGVGLGLTLATQIFGIHGGAIIVDSELKKGTAVKCYLPVKREEMK